MVSVCMSASEGRTENVRISVAIVAESNLNPYLEYVQRTEIPTYEAATGLASFCILHRPFVAYVELITISFWQSERALTQFLETQRPIPAATETFGAIRLEARNYTVLVSGTGKV
jgi:hypothetical protein